MDSDKEDPRVPRNFIANAEQAGRQIPRVLQLENERKHLLDRLAIVNKKIELLLKYPQVVEYTELERR